MQDVQINQRGLHVHAFIVDAVHLVTAQRGDFVFQSVTFLQDFIRLVVVARYHHIACPGHQADHFIADRDEFVPCSFGQRFEVVVHMFFARFADTLHAVNHLFATVAAQMEPCILFDGGELFDASQTDNFLASGLFQGLLLFACLCHGLAQASQVFVDEAVGDVGIGTHDEVHHVYVAVVYMLAQQLPAFFGILAHHELFKDFIVGLFGLLLFGVQVFAAEKQEEGQDNQDNHGDESAVEHHQSHDGSDGERRTGGDEPAADDRKYAGDAVNGRFASPCTVG